MADKKKGKEKTKQGNKLLMRKKAQRLKTGETVNRVEQVQTMKSKMIRGFFRQNAS